VLEDELEPEDAPVSGRAEASFTEMISKPSRSRRSKPELAEIDADVSIFFS